MENLLTASDEPIVYDEVELKAQDKVNLRREARRKKILENAKNRLEKLNGRAPQQLTTTTDQQNDYQLREHDHYNNGPNHLDGVEFSDPEVEPDIIPQQLQSIEPPTDISNLFGYLNTEGTVSQQKRHILLRARLHLIISALLTCIFKLAFSEITVKYYIFLPAGLCVITDLLFFREQQPIHPIIRVIVTLCNIRLPSHTKNIIHTLAIIHSLIVDLSVFLFCFCIFSSILFDSIAIK